MIIAVASGKGGTGKTTVAVSLAIASSHFHQDHTLLLDCDVEAPDAALTLKPQFNEKRAAGVPVPHVDSNRCQHCGRCAEVCAFHAILDVGNDTLVLPELCHGCGSCVRSCPHQAIQERFHVTGILEAGTAGSIVMGRGTLVIGEAMPVPVIRGLSDWMLTERAKSGTVIVDAPPGASCPVVASLRDADYALLVTEPTPFGLHDLEVVVSLVREQLRIPVGVIVNRDGDGDDGVERYCEREGIPILLRIPFSRGIAHAASNGMPLVEAEPKYEAEFERILLEISGEVSQCSNSSF
jgi:MinD superfamily P-loop ATPase